MAHTLTRQELYEMVWAEPKTSLAKKFGVSDVWLSKICRAAICGDSFWSEKLNSSWQRQTAGRCFAHMVYVGTFKFRFVQYKRYATKRYQLK